MNRIRFRLIVAALGSLVLHAAVVSTGDAGKDALGDPLPPGAIARLGTVRLRHAESVAMLRFSPDGKRLLSRGYNTLCLWSTATGEQLRRQTSDSYAITGAFTAEGDILSVFHDKTGIHLTDAMTGKRLRTIPAPEKPIRIFLAPNGKYLGVAVGEGSDRVHLWETATAKEIATFAIAHVGYGPLFFSADSKSLVEVDYESGIRIRETATGMVRSRIRGVRRTELTSLAISPDGKRLATGGYDHVVHVWDATTGKEERVLQNQSASLAFSPDGQTLVCGGWDGRVSFFDAATGKKRRSFVAHVGAVNTIAYSADGKVLATGGGGLFSHRIPRRYHDRDCTIRLWDTVSGKELPPAFGPRAAVVALTYSPDGKALASAGKDHLIRLWSVADGKLLRRLEGHGGTVYSLAFSPNGKVLASASQDKSIRLWEAVTGKVLHELKGHDGEITAVAFSPVGKMLASAGGRDKPICLWDTSTGKEIRMLRAPTSSAYAVAFSPSGRILATGGGHGVLLPSPDADNSIRLWNPRSGQELRRLPGENNDFAFITVTFSPDGKTIAAGCINGSIRLWEAATGAERLTINGAGEGAVVFSPDGRTLAVASPRYSDGAIHLWDALTGKERRLIRGHDGEVYAVTFSPDGKTLASASQDTTVLIWDVADLGRLEPPTKELAAKELETLWDSLAQKDAPQAYRAIRTLIEGKQTVPFLRERLQPIRVTVDRQRIDKLLADLDSEQFEARERAAAELKKLGDLVEPALRKAIASRPPLEVRRRVEDLLDRLDHRILTSEELRGLRAVETLEHIGGAEARRVLEALARGTPGFRLTDEARAAVERLSRRSAANP
jgi:WD40 repeat protein